MYQKLVTNTTGTAIELLKLGVTLQPAVAYTIQPSQYLFWSQHSGTGSQVETLVTSGDILVGDGLSPSLNAVLGLELLRNTLARDIAFDNRVNGFVVSEVQSAIEEAATGTSSGIDLVFDCEAAAAVGELVVADPATDVKVLVITDNLYANVVLGVIQAKPTATTARVRILGRQAGFSGLTRGKVVWVGTDGLPSTTPPASGSLQVLGIAVTSGDILFNIKFDKTVRS